MRRPQRRIFDVNTNAYNQILVDAKDAVVGRLAAFLSKVLRGKNSPSYTPHMDCGQNVVVINADKVVFSGKKLENKIYYRHTGYPGGILKAWMQNLSIKTEKQNIFT